MSAYAGSSTAQAPRVRLALAAAALAGAAGLAVVLNALVAVVAVQLGADGRFGPLQPAQYALWSTGGVAIATAGWLAIRQWAPRPAAVLRWAVPAGVAVSLVPDLLLLVLPLEAHTTGVGVASLMVMHVVVAAVAVPVLARVLPLTRASSATT